MNSKNSICLSFFLLLFSFIFISDAFNIKLSSTIKNHDNLMDSVYSFYSFDKSLKQNQYVIEPYTPLNLCALEKKCKICKPKPPPKPKPKCCNKPTNCCNKNKEVVRNIDGLLCAGKGSCTHWVGGKCPHKLSYTQLAQVWNEAAPGSCNIQDCNSALYNAHRNTNQPQNSTHVPLGHNDNTNHVGMFKLPPKVVINSSSDSGCQASVANDPCKQAYLQQQRLKKGCKGSNWKTPTQSDQINLHKNRDFTKGLAACHNNK